MTSVSQRQLREWLSAEKPAVVADIGGRDSRTAYADICPADIFDLQSSPSFDICATGLPTQYSHIISTDTWEHIFDPVAASRNVGRSLLPGGRLFLTTVSSWPEHRHPVDTYRFMEDGLRWLFRDLHIDKCWYEDDPDGGKRITLIAHKP